jgi:hypothetical protein
MAQPISIKEVDLTPPAGKSYFNIDREWREEFVYFLLVDRFQDDVAPRLQAGRPAPRGSPARTASSAARSKA